MSSRWVRVALVVVTTTILGGLATLWTVGAVSAVWGHVEGHDSELPQTSPVTMAVLAVEAAATGGCFAVALWAGLRRRAGWAVAAWAVALGLTFAGFVYARWADSRTVVHRSTLDQRCEQGRCPATLDEAKEYARSICERGWGRSSVGDCGSLKRVRIEGIDGGDAYFYDRSSKELVGTKSWGMRVVALAGNVPDEVSCSPAQLLCFGSVPPPGSSSQ